LEGADPVRYPRNAGTSGDIPETQRERESNAAPVPTDWELMGDAVDLGLVLVLLPPIAHPSGAQQACPIERDIMSVGTIIEIDEVGGLHHRYERVAA
jgi:hypothetical protein